ncbi:MAG TPA: universal stress protein [Aestuariivirga sp.]|nr:universal stress protein [Alphaproteobacteria bacterium]HRX37086.1 universal stress protein [Aestuariivirga sp.]
MYRDMLIVIDADKIDEEFVRYSGQMAANFDADLIAVVGATVMPTVLPIAGFGAGGGILIDSATTNEDLDEAKARANAAKEKVESLLVDVNQKVLVHAVAGSQAQIGEFAVKLGRAVDLFICYNPFKDDPLAPDRTIFESVMRQAACGALIVPRGYSDIGTNKRVIVAWNNSSEAARAVRVAMPFLLKANRVTVLLVDPDLRQPGDDWRPGDELVQHLDRYGVQSDLARVSSTDVGVAAAIDAELEHKGARLVVMGGYGQSPLKDWVLGSVAREFLETSDLPIIMSN